jgi:hypothetical protein
MHRQIGGDTYESDVIPFARDAPNDADQLDKAGQRSRTGGGRVAPPLQEE